jgi:hypothetical protein
VLAPHPQLVDPGNSRLEQDAWLQPEDRVGVCLGLEQAGDDCGVLAGLAGASAATAADWAVSPQPIPIPARMNPMARM